MCKEAIDSPANTLSLPAGWDGLGGIFADGAPAEPRPETHELDPDAAPSPNLDARSLPRPAFELDVIEAIPIVLVGP